MAGENLTHERRRYLLKFFVPSIKKNPTWPVIISEGDSWFSFPGHDNIIDNLDKMANGKISLLRLEDNGDELLSIMTGKQKLKLRKYLGRFPVDALLLSGGGNDLVGADLLSLLKEKKAAMSWLDSIDQPRAMLRIGRLRDAFSELIQIRDDQRPACKIYIHGYDYAIPTGKPATYWGIKFGPWLKPHLDERLITDPEDQKKVIAWLMDRFNEMLQELEVANREVVIVPTRGTLTPPGDWNDELHPSAKGFHKISQRFRALLQEQFPGTF